ncbi:MAG: TerB family tellurite resistance protein [Porticoccus sp.]|nr:TerB family tellurite resistance protein [Porticoccus sp.]MBQ0807864.1 TerB family tellurite resistance protein [Porticoccus sp.]
MIDRLKQFFTAEIANKEGGSEHQQQLAAASLMVEIMVIDRQLESSERHVIQQLLQKQFELSDGEIERLIELAHQEVEEATSLFQFTRLINDHFKAEEKVGLVENLWRVAYADDHLDKHEEAMIRRIADLLYVSHSDFIRAKHLVNKDSSGKQQH